MFYLILSDYDLCTDLMYLSLAKKVKQVALNFGNLGTMLFLATCNHVREVTPNGISKMMYLNTSMMNGI